MWRLLVLIGSVVTGQPVYPTSNTQWSDVCDPVVKMCGVHSNNFNNNFNDISTFLKPNTYIGPGWTIVVNPYRDSCIVGNCTGVHTTPPPNSVLTTFFVDNAILININNITIRSYYSGVPVSFVSDQSGISERVASGTGLNQIFVVQASAVSLIDMAFTGLNGNYSLTKYTSDLVPVIVNSLDNSNSRYSNLQSTGDNVAVLWFGPTIGGPINVDGMTLDTIKNNNPRTDTRIYRNNGAVAALITDFIGIVTVTATTDLIWMAGVANPHAGYYGEVVGAANCYNATDFFNGNSAVFACPQLPPAPVNNATGGGCSGTTDNFTKVATGFMVCFGVIFIGWLIVKLIHKINKGSAATHDVAERNTFNQYGDEDEQEENMGSNEQEMYPMGPDRDERNSSRRPGYTPTRSRVDERVPVYSTSFDRYARPRGGLMTRPNDEDYYSASDPPFERSESYRGEYV